MGRAITSDQLEARAKRAKARELAILAKKTSTVAKPYAKKPPTDIILASQIGTDNKVFVRIPTPTAILTKIPAAVQTALGMRPANSTPAQLGTGSTVVDFANNHKKVLRVTVYPGLLTPVAKNTSWGSRVVKMVDKSYSFPVGGTSVDAVINAFTAAFTTPDSPMNNEMGNKDSAGYAVLRLGRTILSTARAS